MNIQPQHTHTFLGCECVNRHLTFTAYEQRKHQRGTAHNLIIKIGIRLCAFCFFQSNMRCSNQSISHMVWCDYSVFKPNGNFTKYSGTEGYFSKQKRLSCSGQYQMTRAKCHQQLIYYTWTVSRLPHGTMSSWLHFISAKDSIFLSFYFSLTFCLCS